MNRSSSIRVNSIAQNCRSILRERCIQRTCNHACTFPQQYVDVFLSSRGCPPNAWKPCCAIPTNPICSPYGGDHLRVPTVYCKKPSYRTTLSSPIPSNGFLCHPACPTQMQSILNGPSGHIHCLSTPSENCIEMITNAIINKIRFKIPDEEISLLCCCLPSLIRQIMCKSPWLTPIDVIQWLSADILKEAMNCFDQDNSNDKNKFKRSKQVDYSSEKGSVGKRNDDIFHDNDSLSSHRSSSQESVLSKSDSSKKHQEKKFKKKASTHSFDNRQNDDHESSSLSSTILSPQSRESKQSPNHIETSVPSRDKNSYLSTDEVNPKSDPDNRSPRDDRRIEFPGKKDPNALKDVEKCLAFYDKIREYFDDDVAAMLLKCCLCYGDCSGRR